MIRKLSDFYSYLFQEEDGITAAYFQTITGTEYRVYFYPIHEYFDKLSPDTQLSNFGYFFGFTKMAPNEDKKEPLDFRVRNTILILINAFFQEKGIDKVLIFHCDDDDGKKTKRTICFDLWYEMSETKNCFKKYDEEIVITDANRVRVDTDYMSLIIECNNPNAELLLTEFQYLKEQLIANK
jgi:Family of unknown function (DUF6169)